MNAHLTQKAAPLALLSKDQLINRAKAYSDTIKKLSRVYNAGAHGRIVSARAQFTFTLPSDDVQVAHDFFFMGDLVPGEFITFAEQYCQRLMAERLEIWDTLRTKFNVNPENL